MLRAFREELVEAGYGSLAELSRFHFHLDEDELQGFITRLFELLDEYQLSDPIRGRSEVPRATEVSSPSTGSHPIDHRTHDPLGPLVQPQASCSSRCTMCPGRPTSRAEGWLDRPSERAALLLPPAHGERSEHLAKCVLRYRILSPTRPLSDDRGDNDGSSRLATAGCRATECRTPSFGSPLSLTTVRKTTVLDPAIRAITRVLERFRVRQDPLWRASALGWDSSALVWSRTGPTRSDCPICAGLAPGTLAVTALQLRKSAAITT